MLTVQEALESVLAQAAPRAAQLVACAEACGLVLAEAVTSDVDSPPHDRAVVDGYAVRAIDLPQGQGTLAVIEEVAAGAVPQRALEPGQATRIMTGAPVPSTADAVVMIERTTFDTATAQVTIDDPRFTIGQNIGRRGSSLQRGAGVLEPGTPLRAIEIGLLAEVGRTAVHCIPRPTVAILSTGNELVSADAIPGPAQLRNSNSPLLAALVQESGGRPELLGIGRDDRAELRRLIERGLGSDVLVVSGGVSAGVYDLVPGVLAELGVRQVFHKIKLKPGKPLWFGVLDDPAGARLVFGLPGNPVSSYVCGELFLRPALARLSGRPVSGLRMGSALLAHDLTIRGDRDTYLPARVTSSEGSDLVADVGWQGSGDLAGLSRANALACFPTGERRYLAGEEVTIRWL